MCTFYDYLFRTSFSSKWSAQQHQHIKYTILFIFFFILPFRFQFCYIKLKSILYWNKWQAMAPSFLFLSQCKMFLQLIALQQLKTTGLIENSFSTTFFDCSISYFHFQNPNQRIATNSKFSPNQKQNPKRN